MSLYNTAQLRLPGLTQQGTAMHNRGIGPIGLPQSTRTYYIGCMYAIP